MKPFIQVIFFIFISIHSSSQPDTIIIYLNDKEMPCPEASATKYAVQHKESAHWKKIVFTLADDKPIWAAYFSDELCTQFDGLYSLFSKNNKAIVTGRYINNKKECIWRGFSDKGILIDSAYYYNGYKHGLSLTWYEDGSPRDSLFFEDDGNGTGKGYYSDGRLREEGSFEKGKKNGVWTYYNYKNGKKCQEVSYRSDSAVSYTCYDEKGNVQTKNCYYEKEATFKGGDQGWIDYLLSKLRSAKYPDAYFRGEIFGVVYVRFTVSKDGKLTDIEIENSIDPELDEIALKIIMESPRWEPAVQFNQYVKAYRKQPITFSKAE